MLTLSLEQRVCPVCGTRNRSRLFAEANFSIESLDGFAFASRKLPEYMHWRLSVCDGCDLLYADPAPRPEELAVLYKEAEFDSREEAHHAARTYGRFLPRILSRLPDRKGAVDIGTGDGAFLQELLAAGFENVSGIEPSTAPIEKADPSVRHLIRQDIFRANSFQPDSLSLITCFQTIEHLADPLSFCRHAHRALKPGGALFLIGHNRRAASAKLLGRKSPIFDIEHLQLFSPASMRALLDSAGFSRIETYPVFNRYPLKYWARLFPFPAGVKRHVLGCLQATRPGRWVIPLPAGNLAAIAQKGC
jgi:SAM-dependent methyltransferase